ncbi:ATP-binding protein [Kineococcus sp. SYSU DK003]|uniref:ATP-binding protein n=1 Tax=Kineococcus sp. SYSU DK003 TaxID=3383124 RepID=UPI003D7C8CA0
MIGRLPERARVESLLTAVAVPESPGRAVVVEGEAGIGKTTLLQEVERIARAAGFGVLRCQGLEVEVPAGFAGLHELLHPVLGGAVALPPRQRSALLTALGLDEGPAPDRLLTGLATLGLLEEVAAQQPLLLVVEDLQWLDASSAEVVAFVAGRLTGARLLLVAGLRTGSPATTAATAVQTIRAVAEPVPLAPLSAADCERLLDALDVRLPRQERHRVLAEASGNPLALQEFTRALADRPGTTGTVPLPTTRRLESAFLGAVTALPEPTRELLLLAAAGEDVAFPELLAAAAELQLAPQDLDPAERTGLVSLSEGRLRFRHPLLRSAVYGAASSAGRLAAHRALAVSVRDPDRALWHRAAATLGPDEDVATALTAVGQRTAARGARGEAAVVVRRAADLSPDPQRRTVRLLEAAQYARQAGAVDQASTALDAAAALTREPSQRYEIAYLRSMLGVASGHRQDIVEEVLAVAGELAGPSGRDHPTERITTLTGAVYHLVNQAGSASARATVRDALAAVDAGGPHPVQQVALAVIDPLGHAGTRAALPGLLQLFTDEPFANPYMVLGLAQAAEHLQDLGTAAAAWTSAADSFHRIGSPTDECQALNGRASVRVVTGALPGALADAEAGYRTGTDLSLPMVAASAAAAEARALVLLGRTAEAAEALSRARTATTSDHVPQVVAGLAWAAGSLALAQGRPADALPALLQVAEHPVYAQWAVADLAEAAAAAGRADDAGVNATVGEVARVSDVLGAAHLTHLVHRAHALLADSAQAGEHFRAALAVDPAVPLEVARTRLLHGQWLRRARRIVEARAELAQALHELDRAGAGGLAERAAVELRAAGGNVTGRRAPAGATPGTTLTAQELQVARLVAAGLSNKEIADQLYLSHRTVGTHLHRTFPKLGVTSRGQVRAALERLGVQ